MNSIVGEQYKQQGLYKWYAVYTKSRAEKKALKELEQKGIECYLPVKTIKRTWGRFSRTVEVPLITCYLFVRVSHREHYDVLMASGVLRYVCFEGKPAEIPDYQIGNLKVFMEKENERVEVTSERIRKGDLIRVVEGPLKDVQAEVVELRGKRRIVLRFHTLGCNIHVDLGANRVIVLQKTEKKEGILES
jgi:transcription antitermination factor NusG